jgi:D-glycero-D-manno-heptose 1,7-bisphosphate phosphatase
MIKTVFLDRDGVINKNIPRGYVTSPANLELLPNTAAAIKRLNDAGIPVFVISNQQGVAKGIMSGADLDSVDKEMRVLLGERDSTIGKSYYCTHLSADGCECRKPKGGQLKFAASEQAVDLATSIFVGDSPTDIMAGKDAGTVHNALVLSGATKTYVSGAWPVEPDSVHRDLLAAVEFIFNVNEVTSKGQVS